jgi:signal transduction histidine kinase/PAS domain-containing protein
VGSYTFTIISILFLVSSLVSFFVSFLAWIKKRERGAAELSMMMMCAGIWALFVIFETAALSIELKIFWSKVAYIGALSTPVLYFIFVLKLTGRDSYINRRSVLYLFIVPIIMFLLTLTNNYHNLVWEGYAPISQATNLTQYHHGIAFWIGNVAYNYLLFAISTIYLFRFIFVHISSYRVQAIYVFFAAFFPWVSSIVYIGGFNPIPGFDLVPLSMVVSGVFLSLAIFRSKLLDLAPVARETLLETLGDGILVLDKYNRVQDINNSARIFLGVEGKSVTGKVIESLNLTPKELLNGILNSEKNQIVETDDKNSYRFFIINKQEIKNYPGSRLIIIRDETIELRRERELKMSEERYQRMFGMFRLMADNMQDMLWAKDLDKNFIFANRAICEKLLIAKDTSEPIGRDDMFFALRERELNFNNPKWHTFGELCRNSDDVVINSMRPERFEEYGNVKGKHMVLDVNKAPIFDYKGDMIGIVGSARDVTNQKIIEENLIQRDTLLDAIARATSLLVTSDNVEEAISQALGILGTATKVNRVYIFTNHDEPGYSMPLMSQRYEWTDDTVDKQINNEYLQNLPYEVVCPRWYNSFSRGENVHGDIDSFPEVEKRDLGEQGIVSILATPIFLDKKLWGFIGFDDCKKQRVWTDTEQKLLAAAANTIASAYQRKINQKELLIAKNRAEESDRLKSSFLANLSHEIRTPMNVITGFLELLQGADINREDQTTYITLLKQSSDRILRTLNDIIEISKIEAGQSTLDVSQINLNEIIDYLYNIFKKKAEEKGLLFSIYKGAGNKGALINIDRLKLVSVLTNLVNNSLKFTDKGYVEFGYRIEGDNLVFYVKDSGIGVSADKQEIIFNRFVQAEQTMNRPYEGAGLGLSIVKAYVEMLGGEIRVDSQEGEGSLFYFSIKYSPVVFPDNL